MTHRTAIMNIFGNENNNRWADERYYKNVAIGQSVYVHQLLNYMNYASLFSEKTQCECNIRLAEMLKDYFNEITGKYSDIIKEAGSATYKITDKEFKELVKSKDNNRAGVEEIFWNFFSAVAELPIDLLSAIWMGMCLKMIGFEAWMKSMYSEEIDSLGIKFSLMGGDNIEVM